MTPKSPIPPPDTSSLMSAEKLLGNTNGLSALFSPDPPAANAPPQTDEIQMPAPQPIADQQALTPAATDQKGQGGAFNEHEGRESRNAIAGISIQLQNTKMLHMPWIGQAEYHQGTRATTIRISRLNQAKLDYLKDSMAIRSKDSFINMLIEQAADHLITKALHDGGATEEEITAALARL